MFEIFGSCVSIFNTPLPFIGSGSLLTLKDVFIFAMTASIFGWFTGRLFK